MTNTNTNKAQFNATTAKAFRATMAKWADAHGNINERILHTQDFLKGRRACMMSNQDIIDGKTVGIGKTVEQLKTENDRFRADIDKANADLAEYKKAQSDRINPALALVTDAVYDAYSRFIVDAENGDLYTAYAGAVRTFLENNGVVSGDVTVQAICAKTGADRSSARYELKNGATTKAMAKSKFKDLFVRTLCDLMRSVNALPEYKYAYVPQKERKNAENK